jgi:hypothetical protein
MLLPPAHVPHLHPMRGRLTALAQTLNGIYRFWEAITVARKRLALNPKNDMLHVSAIYAAFYSITRALWNTAPMPVDVDAPGGVIELRELEMDRELDEADN